MHQSGQTRVQTNAIKSTFLKKWCILERFFSGAFPNPCTKNAPLLIFLGQTRVVFFSPKSQLTLIYQRFECYIYVLPGRKDLRCKPRYISLLTKLRKRSMSGQTPHNGPLSSNSVRRFFYVVKETEGFSSELEF